MNQIGLKTLDFLHNESLTRTQRQIPMQLAHNSSIAIHGRDLSAFINNQITGISRNKQKSTL